MTPLQSPAALGVPTLSGPESAPAMTRDKDPASQFEAVMLSILVSNMRKSSFGEGLFPGDKSDTLGGLFDMMVAGQISDSGGIGIQDLVNNWLAENE